MKNPITDCRVAQNAVAPRSDTAFRKSAFTLSETLIALVIIGIVAAITVASLIANSREHHIKNALKKAYSSLNQSLERYQVDNGERYTVSTAQNDMKLFYVFRKYLNNYSLAGNRSPYFNLYKNYNGTNSLYAQSFDDGYLVLNDGSHIMIENCLATTCGNSPVFITVDVNGYGKKPNQLGKDTFMFQLMPEGNLLPMGAAGTKYTGNTYCSPTSSNQFNGASCTNKVLYGE